MHTISAFEGYEWDADTARSNRRRAGIDLADAATAFDDEEALTMTDDVTAVDEQRQLTVARDVLGRVLVVAYAWRGSRLRIFSARRATRRERRHYLTGGR